MDLAILGFVTIGVFLALILFTRTSVLAALVLVPVAAALIGGFGGGLAEMSADGLRTVAPVAALMMFAVLYFGLMIDVGLFEPIVRGLVGLVRGDPVRLCLATAALPMLVALDGDGATTFLISITALLPVHRRLGMNPLILPAVVALSAGVMNLLPWGGPTARAMTALDAGVEQVFLPLLPAMIAGIAWVFLAAFLMGRGERQRLAVVGARAGGVAPVEPPVREPVRVDRLFVFNAVLTVVLIVLLFRDLYAEVVPVPAIPPFLLFMSAFAIALPVNRRGWEAQQAQLASHAASVVLVVSMILAAGVFTGVLNGTGMIEAMARVLAGVLPSFLTPWLSGLVALTSMPLSLVFTPDAYYFGVLPVFAETAAAVGHDPVAIGRAALMGQMTTGFPLSPLTASTFILIGLSGVTLRDHQRFVFKWAFGTTLVMTAVAALTGAL
ncbi:CitMHS family citrate-Mg2+:H+ or citrate-Ca2+:H+ symporter [Brevundimonas nasdae]|uniref:CitMHS family transporter n=1 Tax=Brevundimonas nasdae TaxID=172043 RepID=UPI001912F409|nr:citrate:proton symporter [Brevundimonas nasdae]MBK6025821.1 citrate transporter [Brevundimonas nasdae]MDQ0452326.1 CitMHS family citrate-Mg2+:H+ or citrate-Ca2+:H+ symporter [Brevundimonas nasdae]